SERALAERALREANEQLKRASEIKSQFMAMASHELRTPLTAIEGFTMTMLDRWDQFDEEEKRRFVEIIDSQSHRLTRLVEDLLTLSRVESGKLRMNQAPVNVSLAIKHVLQQLNAERLVIVDS